MKNSKTFFLVLLSVISLFSNAQNEWKKSYSLPMGSFAHDFAETYDNGYLVCGLIRNLTGPWRGYMVKTDINGNKLWQKTIGSLSESPISAMNKTQDGGFIVGGSYSSDSYTEDAYLMKFNECSEPTWCSIIKDYGGHNSTIMPGIHEAPDGSYYFSRYLPTFDYVYRFSLGKLNPDGSLKWMNNYIVDNPDWAYYSQVDWRLAITYDSGFLVTGSITDTVFFQYGGQCDLPHWYKVDTEGNLLWETKWQCTESQFSGSANYSIEDKIGNYYSAGKLLPPLGFPTLFKLSHYGDTIYNKQFINHPDAIEGVATSLAFLNDSTIAIGSLFYLANSGGWALSLIDKNGIVQKNRYEFENFIVNNLLITHDQKILLLGVNLTTNGTFPHDWFSLYKFNTNLEYDSIYTIPHTYDSLCPHPIVSDTIPMPGICHYVSLPEPISKSDVMQLKIYPNPAREYTTVEIPEYSATTTKGGYITQQQFRPLTGEVQLSLINLTGQKVKTDVFDATERNHIIQLANVPPGMYMLQLTQKGKFIAQGKVMVAR